MSLCGRHLLHLLLGLPPSCADLPLTAPFLHPQGVEISLRVGAGILRNLAIVRVRAKLTGIREFCQPNNGFVVPCVAVLGNAFPDHLSRFRGIPVPFPTPLFPFDHRAAGKKACDGGVRGRGRRLVALSTTKSAEFVRFLRSFRTFWPFS